MAKMKTLTVSGQTYTVNDPEAVSFCTKQALTSLQQQIARENIGACTVEQTVDRLCPPFSEADTMVACRPVEGSALAAVSRIVPRQDGTGDPSPDNIRPISGHTAVKLTHCGKNIFGGEAMADAMVSFGATKNEANGTVSFKPHNLSNSSGWIFEGFKENTQYTAIFCGKSDSANGCANIRIRYTDNSNDVIYFDANGYCRIITNPNKQVSAFAFILWTGGGLETTLNYDQCGIFEGVITQEEFEAYRGNTFTLDLEQTVYGGYMDWATGLLTVDRAFKTLTGDGIGIYVEALNPSTRITIQGCTNNGEVQGSACNHLSSHFKTHHGNHSAGIPFWSIGGNKGMSRCWLYCDPAVVGTDTASVNAWLKAQYDAGTPVQVSYKLAMPITVQLTPQEIHALSGVNTLHSDTGDTTVTGKADPSAIIEKLTNAIIALGGNV